jgi:type IVB pilus formation R64 PilN family outer membrane protein
MVTLRNVATSKAALVLLAAVAASGCAHVEQKAVINAHGDKVEQEVDARRTTSMNAAVEDVYAVRIKGRPYMGVRSAPLSEEDSWPPILSKNVNYGFGGRESLRAISERITRIYGVPVRIKADVTSGNGLIGVATQRQPAPGGAPAPTVVQPLPSSPSLIDSNANAGGIEITDYSGPLSGLLDMIAARLGIYWEYQKGSVVFYRTITKTFTVHAVPGDSSFNTKVGKTGSAGGSGSFSSTGEVESKSSWSIWDSLNETLSRISRPDRYYVSQAQGSVTITDTPEVVDMVEKIVERSNSLGSRQVAVRMELVSLTRKQGNETGFDWEAVFQKLEGLVPQWRIVASTPATLTSTSVGALGSAILAPASEGSNLAKFSGTQAMVRLLQEYGNVNTKRAVSTITQNRMSAPLAITNQISYLARTTPGAATGATSTLPGLEPGLVTTGFVANVLPTVLDNNAVLLKVSVDSSELQKIGIVSTGAGPTLQSIQTPEISSVASVNVATLQQGQSLVLTGFELDRAQYEQRGLTDSAGLGGSYVGMRQREKVILIITPTVVNGG